MKAIYAKPNKERTGLYFESDYNRKVLRDWLKHYEWIKLEPKPLRTKKRQQFLEAAVIPCWAQFNYGLDPTDPANRDKARQLFKLDFHYEIIKGKDGDPKRIEKSLSGQHADVLEIYTKYAEENGAPIPNPELYKIYRDQYASEWRWENYYDWLKFLGLEVDSMPTMETFKKLHKPVQGGDNQLD